MSVIEGILPAETPFVTVTDALAAINKLISAQAPTGGTRFGITTSFLATSFLSTPEDHATTGWRIGAMITVPSLATMVGGKLAGWDLPWSRKTIEFVVKADADRCSIEREGEPKRRAHVYTLLNGSFQARHGLSTEMNVAKPFRDPKLRMWYQTTYDATDFNDVLKVIASELTGKPAFPR